ncbi:MAG: hypothetical protein KJO55_09590 [Gammaproteobacteria bacterium]|nr:hypothetical protein [Gammaproteobacteria bacterium]NND59265.1 hypothetical protein [Gammaproteobacteria bacterium]
MGPFEMVVAIVAIACFAGVLRKRLETRDKVDHSELDRSIETRMARLDDMEKRLRVLEKIVTDRNYDLRAELHELDTR